VNSQFVILLVEDNPADARLIVELLADAGAGGYGLQHVERISAALKRLLRQTQHQ